jgi:hypothetical protein
MTQAGLSFSQTAAWVLDTQLVTSGVRPRRVQHSTELLLLLTVVQQQQLLR